MFLAIVDAREKSPTRYKEISHHVEVYTSEQYLTAFPESKDAVEEKKPRLIIIYSYKDEGGGHLFIGEEENAYIMNSDGKTIERL